MADTEVLALIGEYRAMMTHHVETSKLQIPVIAASYFIGAAVLTFALNVVGDPLPLLFLPPLFCVGILVWLHQHMAMIAYRRHVRFVLRPKLENIIRVNVPKERGHIWNWDDEYMAEPTRKDPTVKVAKWARLIGGLQGVSILIPGIAAVLLFIDKASWPPTASQLLWWIIWLAIDALSFGGAIIFVAWVVRMEEARWKYLLDRYSEGDALA